MNDQEEILIVVDEDDNIIDHLPRLEVHQKKLLHRTISIVMFTSSGNLVLQRRSKNKDTYPGMLGNAIGGHVLKGEEYLDAAKNEAAEELNTNIEPEFVKNIIIEDPDHRTITSVYKIVFDGPYKYNEEEIDEITIHSIEDVKKLWNEISPPGQLILKSLNLI